MKIAFLLSCCFLSVAAHQLKYTSTLVKPEQTFTVVVELDGQQILHWDNNTMTMVPDTEWMKNVSLLEKKHWNTETESMKKEKKDLTFLLPMIMDHFKQQEVHSLSQIHGCYTNDENKKGYKWFNYDQKKFLSLDLNTTTWIPADDKAREYLNEKGWDATKHEAKAWKKVLEINCTDSLKLYVKYSRLRQVPPEVKVFQQQSSSSAELVCDATGFFPEAVMMFWEKDGEEVNEDVEVRETLPNQDGSFQKRIILRVSPEDLHKNKYTCVIQHSSLKEELRKEAEQKQVERDDGKVPSGVIVGVVVVGGLLFLVVVGICLWKKNKKKKKKKLISESILTYLDREEICTS